MMRKFLIGVLAGVALAIPASAQSVREAVYADPARAGGVYYMMPVTAYSVTAPPKGYEPVYLSHYGRHGARYLLNDTQYERSLMWLFTPDERYSLWEVNNYIHYMESAPPATKRDLPALWNLVDDGDRAVAAEKPAVRLRFGHDTVFLATLSMVGADGFDIVPGSADGISATWYNFRAPMAATLYFLLCKNREGDVIFKLVVNGADATLPLEAVSGPWYRWNDLKALIASRFPRG